MMIEEAWEDAQTDRQGMQIKRCHWLAHHYAVQLLFALTRSLSQEESSSTGTLLNFVKKPFALAILATSQKHRSSTSFTRDAQQFWRRWAFFEHSGGSSGSLHAGTSSTSADVAGVGVKITARTTSTAAASSSVVFDPRLVANAIAVLAVSLGLGVELWMVAYAPASSCSLA